MLSEVNEEILKLFPQQRFMAAWGEPMIVELGDFLASNSDGEVREVIRVERISFHETYRELWEKSSLKTS